MRDQDPHRTRVLSETSPNPFSARVPVPPGRDRGPSALGGGPSGTFARGCSIGCCCLGVRQYQRTEGFSPHQEVVVVVQVALIGILVGGEFDHDLDRRWPLAAAEDPDLAATLPHGPRWWLVLDATGSWLALLPSGGRVIGPILVNHEQATQGRSGTTLLPSGDTRPANRSNASRFSRRYSYTIQPSRDNKTDTDPAINGATSESSKR